MISMLQVSIVATAGDDSGGAVSSVSSNHFRVLEELHCFCTN